MGEEDMGMFGAGIGVGGVGGEMFCVLSWVEMS